MTTVIPNSVADAMQPRNNAVTVNAITNIAPYGYTIWGNRTLKPVEENLVATNFLNIRNLISDIKKTCYRVARKTTFEQNTDILWINFSSEIGKLLDRMKTGFGISGYKIVKDVEHEKAAEKATLCAKIIIYPTYAVEDFYITVVLKDDEVVVQ
jgi:phage tail sheath protein FI